MAKSTITMSDLRKRGKKITSPVLAEGEVTGHKHALATMEGVERYEMDGRRYLVVTVKDGVPLIHEEHGMGVVAPDIYEERIDREYDYLTEMTRRVED